MTGCKITRPNGFQRIYWKNTIIDRNELRGSAESHVLRGVMPPGTSLELLIGQDKTVLCANGGLRASLDTKDLERYRAEMILADEDRHSLTIGNLSFDIETIQAPN